MKIAYAFRRTAFYPYQGGTGWEIPPPEVRGQYLRKVREIGFEGIEIGLDQGVGRDERVECAPCAANWKRPVSPAPPYVVGAGSATAVRGEQIASRLLDAIQMAGWIGAGLVNMSIGVTPARRAGELGGRVGGRVSQGGSRTATEADYALTRAPHPRGRRRRGGARHHPLH